MPIVSVIIPTYNRSKLVRQTINSVLAQNYKDFEILVIDDGSTDNTKQTIAEIKDDRTKYFYKNNGGVSSARNLGLKNVQGQFICFLDSDDLWPNNFLATMTANLQNNSQYGAAYCMRTLLFENGSTKPSYQKGFFSSGKITQQLFEKTFIQTSAICFRKKVLEGIFFDESLTNGEDVDVWLRVSTRTQFLFVPDIQIIYRQQTAHPDSPAFHPKYCNRIRVLERFYFRLGGNKHIPHKMAMRKLSYAYRSSAKKAIKASCRKAAI
jgi:glycosyltransferase involved in cell wall biosynthesis